VNTYYQSSKSAVSHGSALLLPPVQYTTAQVNAKKIDSYVSRNAAEDNISPQLNRTRSTYQNFEEDNDDVTIISETKNGEEGSMDESYATHVQQLKDSVNRV
jgi:hypothetical protein